MEFIPLAILSASCVVIAYYVYALRDFIHPPAVAILISALFLLFSMSSALFLLGVSPYITVTIHIVSSAVATTTAFKLWELKREHTSNV